MTRRRVKGPSPFEDRIGFSRAIRVGNRVLVAGTAPVWEDGTVHHDPEVQARRCIEIIEKALNEAGATLDDVVRTRQFIVDPDDAEAVGRAHAAAFGEARPVSTMVVVSALLDPRWRVEIEAEAVVDTE